VVNQERSLTCGRVALLMPGAPQPGEHTERGEQRGEFTRQERLTAGRGFRTSLVTEIEEVLKTVNGAYV